LLIRTIDKIVDRSAGVLTSARIVVTVDRTKATSAKTSAIASRRRFVMAFEASRESGSMAMMTTTSDPGYADHQNVTMVDFQ
jgi:hypothetical protein